MNRATWLQGRRMLKFRDVLNRWERRELSMMEAGELLGMSERQFRRYRERFEEDGEAGLIDRRLGKPSPKRIAAGEIDRMLELYRNVYRGWNVKHFHEHGMRDHQFAWGYTWTKTQLHTAGLVERAKRRGAHRRKRERKPCEGMMLHQDGSQHVWLEGQPPLDLIVTMDDATRTIYSAFLVEQEGTISSFCGLLEVFEARGLPCSIYSDRASHYFHTDKAGEAVDKAHLTQVGRALDRLGIEHIPAYSPEERAAAASACSGRCRTGWSKSSNMPACAISIRRTGGSVRSICRGTMPVSPSLRRSPKRPLWPLTANSCARHCASKKSVWWAATTQWPTKGCGCSCRRAACAPIMSKHA
jgi:Winged helix-turn helix